MSYFHPLHAYATDQCPEVKNPAVDCKHLGCKSALNPTCQVKCGQGLIDAAAKNCPIPNAFTPGYTPQDTISQGIAAGQYQLSPGLTSTSTSPSTDPDADCNPWGPFKFICSGLKGLQKGYNNLAGNCMGVIPIPCIWIGVVVVATVLLAILIKRR